MKVIYMGSLYLGNNLIFPINEDNGISYNTIKNYRPSWFREHIVCEYDVKRQGETNSHNLLKDKPILRDISGNGLDIELRGFDWSPVNGIGKYTVLPKNWANYMGDIQKLDYKLIINSCETTSDGVTFLAPSFKKDNFKFRVSNLNGHTMYIKGYSARVTSLIITKDGTYEFKDGNKYVDKYLSIGFDSIFNNENIIIEFLPYQKDIITFDGVNDYGICLDIPNLLDYTIFIDRKYLRDSKSTPQTLFTLTDDSNSVAVIESSTGGGVYFNSFGVDSSCNISANNVIYFTPTSYNGTPISKGSYKPGGKLKLIVGIRKDFSTRKSNVEIRKILLFDKTLSSSEISWVNKNIMN